MLCAESKQKQGTPDLLAPHQDGSPKIHPLFQRVKRKPNQKLSGASNKKRKPPKRPRLDKIQSRRRNAIAKQREYLFKCFGKKTLRRVVIQTKLKSKWKHLNESEFGELLQVCGGDPAASDIDTSIFEGKKKSAGMRLKFPYSIPTKTEVIRCDE